MSDANEPRPSTDLAADCGRVRSELPSLVYGELPSEARAALERHLAGCAPCSEELAAVRDTQALLSRWETPRSHEDPRTLAREVAARAGATPAQAPERRALPRRARLVRWSAILSGAAAALVFTLSVLNARASLGGGRLELSFGLPGVAPAPSEPVDLTDEMRAIATEVVAARTASFERDWEELVQRLSQMTQEQLLRLSQAVDVVLAQNQRSLDDRLTLFGREAARADLETRRALTDLASYIPNNR
jgi:hypothetical protein